MISKNKWSTYLHITENKIWYFLPKLPHAMNALTNMIYIFLARLNRYNNLTIQMVELRVVAAAVLVLSTL
jgi:hypothetical protein